MIRHYTSIIAVFLLSLTSCRKYVELIPKGQLLPQQIIDFRYLLNNSSVLTSAYGHNEFGTDDVDFNAGHLISQLGSYEPFYIWQKQLFQQTNPDQDWTQLYKIIYYANIVINEAPNASDGSADEKNELIGEAMVHRAYAYWALINQYAKQYNTTTATTDAGVPLLITASIHTGLTRATVRQVYDLIVSDLQTAVDYLPKTQPNNVYPSKVAAYGLLARTYLFMGNYTGALEQATNALNIKSDLLDLRQYVSQQYALPAQIANPEIVLLKRSDNNYFFPPFRLSDELLNLLGSNDLRYSLYTDDGTSSNYIYSSFPGRGYVRNVINGENCNVGLTVPEILLTKAECQARSGNASDAMNTIDALRVNRYLPADYIPSQANSNADALKKVLDERRRELFMNGLRWFDMKRLNTDPNFAKTIIHYADTKAYTLAPNGNNYIFQISPYIIQLSPGITQNPRD